MNNLVKYLSVLFVLGVLGINTFFIVGEYQQAIILQFGEYKATHNTAGLKIKIPFIQNVVYLEKRLFKYDLNDERVILGNQETLVVDGYIAGRITNPLLYYQSVRTDRAAEDRLLRLASASLRNALGHQHLSALLSDKRTEITSSIQKSINESATSLGIEVVDFQIRRAELPEETNRSIFNQMISERQKVAQDIRAKGTEMANEIQANAERKRAVILAEARKAAQSLKGEGDAEAIKVYASAFGQGEEFFKFYRSLQAYRQALITEGTTLVLTPNNDFFRYFENINGNTK